MNSADLDASLRSKRSDEERSPVWTRSVSGSSSGPLRMSLDIYSQSNELDRNALFKRFWTLLMGLVVSVSIVIDIVLGRRLERSARSTQTLGSDIRDQGSWHLWVSQG